MKCKCLRCGNLQGVAQYNWRAGQASCNNCGSRGLEVLVESPKMTKTEKLSKIVEKIS